MLGNHEGEAAVFENESIHYAGGKLTDFEQFQMLGVSGSDSSLALENGSTVEYLGGFQFLPSKVQLKEQENKAFVARGKQFLEAFASIMPRKQLQLIAPVFNQ